ncbi:hypothetical protein B0H13DRAFT_2341229 [Mycena leptocephala]|nr:hypothetical protein B0H13DRAFT_2341229 [Mycena leptocephala]
MPADDTSTHLSAPHLPITDANKHRRRANLPTDRYLDFDKPMLGVIWVKDNEPHAQVTLYPHEDMRIRLSDHKVALAEVGFEKGKGPICVYSEDARRQAGWYTCNWDTPIRVHKVGDVLMLTYGHVNEMLDFTTVGHFCVLIVSFPPIKHLLSTTPIVSYCLRFPSTTMSTSSKNDGSLRKQILAQREAEEVQIHAQEQQLSKLAVDLWVRGFQRMDEQLPATSASERPDEIARDNGIPKLHVQGHQEEGSYHLYDWMMTTFSEDPAAWVRFRRPTMESAFEHYCHTRLDLRAKNGDWVWDEEIPELVD